MNWIQPRVSMFDGNAESHHSLSSISVPYIGGSPHVYRGRSSELLGNPHATMLSMASKLSVETVTPLLADITITSVSRLVPTHSYCTHCAIAVGEAFKYIRQL